MILVLNVNASLDKRYEVKDMIKGKVIRAKGVQNTPGGKGIHVANVITILNEECITTGFLGGKTGELISEKLDEYKIKQDFIKINGETRSCLAIISDDFAQTEILEPGPEVSETEQSDFLAKYVELLKNSNIVVASGSVPKNIPSDIYKKLIEIANSQGKIFLLDSSGELLKQGIKGKPYFIKPNKDEIEALTGRKIITIDDAVEEIKKFQLQGIKFVVISLGAEGSVAGVDGKFYKVDIPKVKAVNPVGSGDSYVAGVAISIQRKYSTEETLKFATACGTANAMEKESGFVTESVVNELIDKITIKQI
jgi:tagatose 6-phosphate kinase